ncbi:MAG: ATP-binding cassette domain-containing protein [Deltaproteobacteria bacterium]|nr:ATP-binding cassette domain-containing protein [Deltaproteobacteria bacterium]
MTTPALDARAVGVRRGGRPIVVDVDVVARPGEVVALLGPNGAGKSTLLEALAGDRGATGAVRVGGDDVRALAPLERAKRLAFLRQEQALPFPMTALDVVLLGRSPHCRGVERPVDHAVAFEALAATGVAGLAARPLGALSGGERRRVHVARVLAQLWGDRPPSAGGPERGRVLLLDEPTAGLDLGRAQGLLRLCREQAASGVAVVVVLHDLNEALQVADRVAVLAGGRLVAEGAPLGCLTPSLVASVFDAEVRLVTDPGGGAAAFIPCTTRADRAATEARE